MEPLTKPSPRLLGCTAAIGAAAAFFIEAASMNIAALTPFILILLGVLLCYNLLVLKNLFPIKNRLRSYIVLFYWGVFLVLFCLPIDEIYGRSLLKAQSSYMWLQVCLGGLLCLTSLINYMFLHAKKRQGHTEDKACFLTVLSPANFMLVTCGWVFLCTNLISLVVFENIPHVQDSIAQFFQAKIFANGHLTVPPPPIPDFFQYPLDNIIIGEQWYSQYTPGHPFLIMLGLIINMPWVVNPILATLSAVLLYLAGRKYYGEVEARGAVALYCLSPFVLFMSASFMNHVSSLFFVLLFFYCILLTLDRKSIVFGIIAGFALGAVLNIRTGDAVAIGAVVGVFFVVCNLKAGQYRTILAAGFSFMCMLAILLWYNYSTNGNAFLFGYQAKWGAEHTLGFTNKMIMGAPPHTFLRGIGHTISNFIALNQNLFEWPLPSLLPLAIFFTPFGWHKGRKETLLLLMALGAPVFYFFYFFQDLCLGPRFYYISLPFILLLTARSFVLIIKKTASSLHISTLYLRNGILLIFGCLFIYTAILRVPQLCKYYSDSFWDIDNKLMRQVEEKKISNALIFQKEYGVLDNGLGSGFLYNSPLLNTPVIFARDLDNRNSELKACYPSRRYYKTWRDSNGAIQIEPLKSPDSLR